MMNSKEIRRAIDLYMAENGLNNDEMGKKIESTGATISRWKTGGTDIIHNKNWSKLYPLIKPYLPLDYILKPVVKNTWTTPAGLRKLESLIKSLSADRLRELEDKINEITLKAKDEIVKML